MKLLPLGDRVVVRSTEDAESRTPSGLVIPDTAKEKPQVGEVVAVGPGARDDDGERIAMDVSGFEGGVVVERVRAADGASGFNAATGVYEDLVVAGIIDPAKVTRSTLQNAASIAALLLTTEALIAEQPEDAPARVGCGHDGGGMDF